MHPLREYAAKTLGYKKVAVVSLDYAFGWEIVGGFQQTFEDNGGQIIQSLDSSQRAGLRALSLPDSGRMRPPCFVLALGRWTLTLRETVGGGRAQDKMPLIAGGTYTDEHVLPELGDESIGVISAHHYSAALDTPAQPEVPRGVREEVQSPPLLLTGELLHGSPGGGGGGQGGGGRVEDRAAFMAALRSGDRRCAARSHQDGSVWQSHAEHLHPRFERVNGKLQNT